MVCDISDPNKKGIFGEIAVLKDLTSKGYEVFKEIGSSSKVDLIVLSTDYKPYKVQVKTCNIYRNRATLYLIKKCLQNKYNSTYDTKQVDIFALYVIEKDIVLYISAIEALNNRKNSITFCFETPKNGQAKGINLAENYLDINKVISSPANIVVM